MEHIKKIVFCSIFIIASQTCNYSYAWGDDVGINAVNKLENIADKAEETIERLVEKSLPALSDAAPVLGTKFGREMGVGFLETIGGWGAALYAFGTPFVVPIAIGTGLSLTGFAAYKTYRCYHPTPEQIARTEEQQLFALEAFKKREALMAEAAFKNCLKNNPNSKRNAMGVPSPCESAIHAYAMAAGHNEVDETMKTFNRYAPQGA
ncbi:MAG: hypothetical protein P4L31_00115 [Candidatus Babeliales bacterium]|nr:hypothetical protein [Candidatus Babeliales bacterium]